MFRNKVLSIILIIISLVSLMGCSEKTEEAYIYFELPQLPSTLDPQIASSDSELLIVRNIYEGLLRKDEKGEMYRLCFSETHNAVILR